MNALNSPFRSCSFPFQEFINATSQGKRSSASPRNLQAFTAPTTEVFLHRREWWENGWQKPPRTARRCDIGRVGPKLLGVVFSIRRGEVKHLLTVRSYGDRCLRSIALLGSIRNFVCGETVDHQADMALMKRSPKSTAN